MAWKQILAGPQYDNRGLGDFILDLLSFDFLSSSIISLSDFFFNNLDQGSEHHQMGHDPVFASKPAVWLHWNEAPHHFDSLTSQNLGDYSN